MLYVTNDIRCIVIFTHASIRRNIKAITLRLNVRMKVATGQNLDNKALDKAMSRLRCGIDPFDEHFRYTRDRWDIEHQRPCVKSIHGKKEFESDSSKSIYLTIIICNPSHWHDSGLYRPIVSAS
jgi:hypothetical protein